MKKARILLYTLSMLLLCSSAVYADTTSVTTAATAVQNEVYLQLEQNVCYPANWDKKSKLPAVFLVHNGFEDKSAWGDFPQQVADAGFFAVNITWKAWHTTDVETAIQYNFTKYDNIIDTNRVLFIGGCHGGKDTLQIMSHTDLIYKITSAVVLSVSEDDQAVIDSEKAVHTPILAYYSKKDVYYKKVSKHVAEDLISQPKQVIALDETTHGDNVVTQALCKDNVRNDIIV